MLEKTSVIVLNSIKYTDNSKIVNVYSKDFGKLSLIVNISSSKKGKLKNSLFQNLNILEIEFSYKEKNNVHRLRDANSVINFCTIPFDIRKTALATFISEVLSKTLKEETAEIALFDFIKNSIITLDKIEKNISIFHIHFLINYSSYLGFEPLDNENKFRFFDLKEGLFTYNKPIHNLYLNELETTEFYKLFKTFDINNITIIENKKIILEKLLIYYKIHFQSFGELNSYQILREVFN